MKTVAIVASRYGSTRFPAKALADICGKPMVWWAYQQTKLAKKIDEVYVATDDDRIVEVCNKYNSPSIMTKTTHREAANRLQEVSEKIKLYSAGWTGSRQKISICAPVSRWKFSLAGTTFVSLKTMIEFSGMNSGISMKRCAVISPWS